MHFFEYFRSSTKLQNFVHLKLPFAENLAKIIILLIFKATVNKYTPTRTFSCSCQTFGRSWHKIVYIKVLWPDTMTVRVIKKRYY